MTFEIPFLVADNQVKRYAALLDVLALGIAKTDCSSLENNILAMNVMGTYWTDNRSDTTG